MPPDAFAELWEESEPRVQKDLLLARFRDDRAAFARFCWPGRFYLPFNACHRDLLGDTREPFDERPTLKDAKAAPRGIGKSSISSFVDPIHGIVYGLERLIVVLTAVSDLSDELVDDIRAAFTDIDDSPLNELFGPFKITGGKTDFYVSCNGAPPVRVVARSMGAQIRGIKFRGERPTMVILDDSERSDRVRSADQRAVTYRYLTDDVLKSGRKQGGTEYRCRGTVLHSDSMLAALLRHAGWQGRRWQSIISWPDNSQLWDQCGKLWKNLADTGRKETARAFYDANREAMHKGAEVLDPVAEPIFALYELIWEDGLSSFLREKQNEPRHAAAALFNSVLFSRCQIVGDRITNPNGTRAETIITADGREVPLADCRVGLYLDPIPGKELGTLGDEGGSGGGDYAAIAAIARDPLGYRYVLDVFMRRCRDTEQLAALWTMAERWHADRAWLEAVLFQRLIGRDFRRLQAERKKAGLYWQLTLDEDFPQGAKEDRIATLEVPTTNGWMQFSQAVTEPIYRQFDDFPEGDHDDAIDAIAGCDRNMGGNAGILGGERLY